MNVDLPLWTCYVLQVVVLSVGRYDDHYIITEEPSPHDHLIQELHSAITTSKCSAAVAADAGQDAGLHLQLPFELRALETILGEAVKLLAKEVRGVVFSAHRRLKKLGDRAVRLICFLRA
jgi:Zn-dependent M16 (insulinase) family peptidase